MRTLHISFFSAGIPIAGILRLPDQAGPHPGIVQGPGWLGLKEAKLYLPYHEALTSAGFAVLIIDYRGFGESEGEVGLLSPRNQVEDLFNAVTFLTTIEEIDPNCLGVFGTGGTGGGNAILLASTDSRIRCVVSQAPIADGKDWLRRMRPEYEWYEFLGRLEDDRRQRVITGQGALVDPTEEIMVATPERKSAGIKKDVVARVPTRIGLSAADEILNYRPIDSAANARNMLVIAVEDDPVTPTDHAVSLYDAAPSPKKLILQRHTSHYAAYSQYREVVTPRIVDWFVRNLQGRSVEEITPDGITILKEQP